MKRSAQIISVYTIFFSLSIQLLDAQQLLRYNIFKGDEQVGQLEAQRIESGNTVYHKVNYSLELRYVIKVKLLFEFECKYENGLLTYSKTRNYRDDKLREATELTWEGDHYVLHKNGKANPLDVPQLSYSTIPMMFKKPPKVAPIFSERFGTFLPLKKLPDGRYEMTLVSGNKNYYSYQNNVCDKFIITHPLGNLNIELISSKAED